MRTRKRILGALRRSICMICHVLLDIFHAHFHFLLFFMSHFEPLPFRGTSLWSQGIESSLPRYTPCILVSRIGSALPHRVNSHLTNSVNYFVYSRSHAFHGGNRTLRNKTQCIGNRTLDFYPNDESRTITPPGCGGIFAIDKAGEEG